MKLLFIINPKAGRTAIRNDLFEIIMIFSKAGYEVITYPTKGPDDAERKVREEGSNYDLIVCAGGDGTLENTVCGYMTMGEKKVPIGYIPVGTTNDFARSLKISRKPILAAKQIVEGNIEYLDAGRFEDKYFIYIAAFGIFTDISYSTKQSLKKVMGHSAYVIEAVKNIMNYRTFELEAEFDGSVVTGEYIYGMVTNSFSVAGFKIRGTKHVVLDDGKFDCLLIRKPQNPAELQQIITALLTNNIDGNEMFYQKTASKVVIKSKESIPWTLDGEYGGERKEVVISNIKKQVGICIGRTEEANGIIERNEDNTRNDDNVSEDYFNDYSNDYTNDYSEDYSEDYSDGWD